MANFNKNKLIDFLIKIICIGGLIFQTKELLSDYLSGKTVISLELKNLDEEPIPAITICLRYGFSMHQVCKEDIFQILCNDYMENLRKYEILQKFQNTKNESWRGDIIIVKKKIISNLS